MKGFYKLCVKLRVVLEVTFLFWKVSLGKKKNKVVQKVKVVFVYYVKTFKIMLRLLACLFRLSLQRIKTFRECVWGGGWGRNRITFEGHFLN